jgi:hypothetical protein
MMDEHRRRVSENRVPRRLFGPKRDEVRGVEKLNKDGLYELYSSPNIIHVSKSRMTWPGHVARTGRREVHKVFWWG